MATTAQQVFATAMGLMDQLSPGGTADSPDTREYRDRTLLILNALRGELFPYSDTYAAEEPGKRPILAVIQSFDQVIGMDDYICQSVLPYGLAAQLLLDENPDSASFFQQRYEEMRMNLAKGLPQQSESISDVYGIVSPYNEFSRW